MTRLPRLIYIGDIPIEDSHHSSAQLFRLLRTYPAEQLCVIETRDRPSREDRRLPGVRYVSMPLANPRMLKPGRRGAYLLWQIDSLPLFSSDFERELRDFGAEACLTIGSGTAWAMASMLAKRAHLPLHFIAHDDWPKLTGIDRIFQGVLRRRFSDAYRGARSRLCISPYMAEEFARRYGCNGTVLYPIYPADPGPELPREAREGPLQIGYCGGSGAHVMPGLETLARAAARIGARIVVYGPFDAASQQRLIAIAPVFDFRGFIDSATMLRAIADLDVLFVPMAFDAESRDNMIVSFPSKLVEYCASSTPIVVLGPRECSAARWAADHDAAVVVDRDDAAALAAAFAAVHRDADRGSELAAHARTFGERAFSTERGRQILHDALLQ